MREILVSYNNFKVISSKGITVYYIPYSNGFYDVITTTSDFICIAHVSTPEDVADFETYKKGCAEVSSPDEAAALDNASSGGRHTVKQQPFSKVGRNYFVSGRRFSADLGKDTNCDTVFEKEIELQGVKFFVDNATDGDSVDFVAVHPVYGVVLQWGESIFIRPRDSLQGDYTTCDSKTIPAGLVIRATYHSVSTGDVKPVLYFDFIGWA